MASLTAARPGLRWPVPSPLFLGAVLAVPVALAVGHALPAEGAGLGLRLAAAAAFVLLVPGALVLRSLGWPASLGVALAGSLAWSLAACFLAVALTLAANASLSLTVAILAALCGAALLAAWRTRVVSRARSELLAVGGLVLLGLVLCAVAWWAIRTARGEELFHVARVRKLDEVPVLYGVGAIGEFRDGGADPGHAFPLWHGVLALVGRLAGVGPAEVVTHLGALLAPLALVLAYAAGSALFSSVAAGVATALGQLVVLGFGRGGLGAFERLALPEAAALLLLVPALLALTFAWVHDGRRGGLVSIAVLGLALGAVHATTALLVAVPLAGFALARLAVGGHAGRVDARRTGVALAFLLVPLGLFAAWLTPVLVETNAFLPGSEALDRAAARSPDVYDAGPFLGFEPSGVVPDGAGVAAGLVAAALAVVAARCRWGALAFGGTVAVLVTLLVPPLFTGLAAIATLPQASRLGLLMPLSFALAGACLLLARAATSLGGSCARRAVAVSAAVAIPFAAVELAGLERDPPDPHALPAPLVEVLRRQVPIRATLFSNLEISYRVAAAVPLYVAAIPPAFAARTEDSRPLERRRDVIRFFWQEGPSYLERAQILAGSGASWLLVDRTRGVPAYVDLLPVTVYDDGRYALFPLRGR